MRTSILIAESVSFSSIAEAKTSEKDNALKEEYYLDFAGESRLCSSLPSCICEEECSCLKTKKKWKQRLGIFWKCLASNNKIHGKGTCGTNAFWSRSTKKRGKDAEETNELRGKRELERRDDWWHLPHWLLAKDCSLDRLYWQRRAENPSTSEIILGPKCIRFSSSIKGWIQSSFSTSSATIFLDTCSRITLNLYFHEKSNNIAWMSSVVLSFG